MGYYESVSMTPAVGRLIELGGAPFARELTSADDQLLHLGPIGASIREVQAQKNGFFCFESALRFFPSTTVEFSWGTSDWNSSSLWKAAYGGIANDIFCFAEDVFGRQFVVNGEKISVFDPETGDLEIVAPSLEEWASIMLLDFRQLTGHPLAHQWQTVHGPLHPRDRLIPRTPFVLGGEFSIENLEALDSVRVMKNLGNLASQIHDLPNGAKIQFKIL